MHDYKSLCEAVMICAAVISGHADSFSTDLYKYSPVAVPPIHAISYHVATDKPPAQYGDKFRSIFSDNLQPIATRGKKARGTLLVDKHCGTAVPLSAHPSPLVLLQQN